MESLITAFDDQGLQAHMIPTRSQAIQAYKDRGGQIAAVLPIHPPRALLRAFDTLPVEVWGPPAVDASYGGAHLQPYVCSIVRNALSFLLAGGLEVVDYILVPHACDSITTAPKGSQYSVGTNVATAPR